MPNREYVIRCLKYLHDRETWKEGPLVWDDRAADRRRITADALSLLLEQEPVKPVKEQIFSSIYGWVCGACSFPLLSDSYTYCPRCGRAVKWDT